jgi:hypothetical protein
MTHSSHGNLRTRRLLQAAAFAMPLVTLAATPALAEAAPSPTAYVTVAPQATEEVNDSTMPVAPAEIPDPFTSAVPDPTVAATDPAQETAAATPDTTPEPSATAPTDPPSEVPPVEPSTPAASTAAVPEAPVETAGEVTPHNAALAAAIQQRIINEPQFRLEFIAIVKNLIATDPVFAAKFVTDVQHRVATEPFFAATWRAAVRASQDANVHFGATSWPGGTVRHPRGVGYYSQVSRWGELVLGVMTELNIDPYYFPGILAQIQQESAGNPGAVNGWDFNARMGYASMGLLQVIAPTYRAHARPGYQGTLTYVGVPGTGIWQQFASPWQTHPYTNLYAALRYVISRYGISKFKSWNAGYNQGY